MTLKGYKLPLEMEPVASDDNMIFMLKADEQTFGHQPYALLYW